MRKVCHVSHVLAQTLRQKAAQRGSRERVREMALCVGEDIETSLVAPWRIVGETKDSAARGATCMRFPYPVGNSDESARESAGMRYEDLAQRRADIDVRGRRGWRRWSGRRGAELGSRRRCA